VSHSLSCGQTEAVSGCRKGARFAYLEDSSRLVVQAACTDEQGFHTVCFGYSRKLGAHGYLGAESDSWTRACLSPSNQRQARQRSSVVVDV
jgi:hypothetical protein